jgi:UDP-N-acetylmuramoyl-L-alanyl-D-glutamate--2,6-diaminopimelate ligase
MWIYEALLGVEVIERTSTTVEATGVQYDSRRVRAGDIFVAMVGGTTDGNKYIGAALERGAASVVTDSRDVWERNRANSGGVRHGHVPFFLVANGRRALAGIAANLLGHPERKLKVSAVTGTNGKTTTAYLLEQMLKSVGRKCILVGTIETHLGDEVRPSEHTTPEASDLLQLFADGVAAGCTEVVMEMSSHALDQERVWGVQVDVGIFTNLTQDHLDYHGSMGNYASAKAKLFAGVGTAPPRVSVINADDPLGDFMANKASSGRSMAWRYGLGTGNLTASYRAEQVRMEAGKTTFAWLTPYGTIELDSPLTGKVNVYNLLAASSAALARGLSFEQIAAATKDLQQVPGRFQVVPGSQEAGFTVVIDYAHTDDALRNLIALARELVAPTNGRVITLFGCGGDRDRTKRPKMGKAAGEGSDLVILTSDNPRGEDPEAILAEALAGVKETAAECWVEPDRATAIAKAIHAAKPGDIVLIAGKGHEKVQILKEGPTPFDDVEVAAEVLRRVAHIGLSEPMPPT